MLVFKDNEGRIFSGPHLLYKNLPYAYIPFEESFDLPLVQWLLFQGITNPVFVTEMDTEYLWISNTISDNRELFFSKVENINAVFIFVPYLKGFTFRLKKELKGLFPQGLPRTNEHDGYCELTLPISNSLIDRYQMILDYLVSRYSRYNLPVEKVVSILQELQDP